MGSNIIYDMKTLCNSTSLPPFLAYFCKTRSTCSKFPNTVMCYCINTLCRMKPVFAFSETGFMQRYCSPNLSVDIYILSS